MFDTYRYASNSHPKVDILIIQHVQAKTSGFVAMRWLTICVTSGGWKDSGSQLNIWKASMLK